MKVAILHDYLNQFGGAERVLKVLLEIFPQADLYTLLYDKNKTFSLFDNNIRKTSFLDKRLVRQNHRFFIPLMPLAARNLKTENFYDLIISSSAGYAKGFNIKGVFHVCYCHSPLRYAWEIDYLKNLSLAPRALKDLVGRPIARWLRNWDKKAAGRPDLFIANSQFIADKIKNYYQRESHVVYPPVDFNVFHPEPATKSQDYYLMVGRLLYYKGFDIGIKAFNFLKKPLKIAGSGPEKNKLQKMNASPLTEFISGAPDKNLRDLYVQAKALIFPQIEDFGLVAAEAQACGLPVIAFHQGGGKEIVEDKKTGLLFKEQNPAALIQAVHDFEKMSFNRRYIAEKARRFSNDEFKRQIAGILAENGIKI